MWVYTSIYEGLFENDSYVILVWVLRPYLVACGFLCLNFFYKSAGVVSRNFMLYLIGRIL